MTPSILSMAVKFPPWSSAGDLYSTSRLAEREMAVLQSKVRNSLNSSLTRESHLWAQDLFVGGKLRQRTAKHCRAHATIKLRAQSFQSLEGTGDPIPLVSGEELVQAMGATTHLNTSTYRAFYSSIVDAITTDPVGMVIPIDDHIVHRGHGVFDTAIVWDRHLYELDEHLQRLQRSAAKSKISLPFSPERLRQIILQTAAAGKFEKGFMRYWLSVGPGGFGLSPTECKQSTFYVMAISSTSLYQSTAGVRVITSSIPIKPPEFATTKSVNYLPNAMVLMEAEEQDAVTGIWLDQDGYIGEGHNMNCCFVSQDDVLLVPGFETILAGCTMKRVMALAQEHLVSSNGSTAGEERNSPPLLSAVRMGRVGVEEARAAKEMMLCGRGLLVQPVLQWDNQPVGTGEPGPVAKFLRQLLLDFIATGPQETRVPIPHSPS
eukprot:TRINITY_DN2975_c0_g1_i10.p1 TRINITY_DN2975_c0_g1~~TRINITY_DN2975_c0_g1_i10.p1  ORF type:complete len:433 (-),score=53.01 TRINITY_DN2975_c0_g1_i10:404-1702(-)